MPSASRIVLVALAALVFAAAATSVRPARTDHLVVRKIPERHAPWRIATTPRDTSRLDYISGLMLIAVLGAGIAYSRALVLAGAGGASDRFVTRFRPDVDRRP